MEDNRMTIKETNIAFIFFLMAYVGLAMAVGTILPDDMPYWAEMCVNQVIIILPVIVIIFVRKNKVKSFLMLDRVSVGDVVLAYIGAYCLLPLIYLINYCSSFFAKNYVNDMVAELYSYPLWMQLILLAVLPAAAEEFIFRGFFYGNYRKKQVFGAALMSGLLFGIAHLNLNQFAYAFVIGVAFSVLYEASGNILIPMTAHFAINANTVFLVQLMMQYEETMPVETAAETVESAQNITAGVGYNVMFVAMMTGVAVLFTSLFGYIVAKIADKHGRNGNFLPQKVNEGLKEKFVDVYWALAVIPAIVYMIVLEM